MIKTVAKQKTLTSDKNPSNKNDKKTIRLDLEPTPFAKKNTSIKMPSNKHKKKTIRLDLEPATFAKTNLLLSRGRQTNTKRKPLDPTSNPRLVQNKTYF